MGSRKNSSAYLCDIQHTMVKVTETSEESNRTCMKHVWGRKGHPNNIDDPQCLFHASGGTYKFKKLNNKDLS